MGVFTHSYRIFPTDFIRLSSAIIPVYTPATASTQVCLYADSSPACRFPPTPAAGFISPPGNAVFVELRTDASLILTTNSAATITLIAIDFRASLNSDRVRPII
jgi:hypothetical protein